MKTKFLISVFCLVMSSTAGAAVNLTFSSSNAKLTNLQNATGTASGGLTWGIVIDTAGNGFNALNGTHYFEISPPPPFGSGVFLRDHTYALTDDYFLRASSDTLAVLLGNDGGTNGVASISVPYAGPINAGDSFAIVWFSTPGSLATAAGQNYGLLWIPQFVLPPEGSGANFSQYFPGPDPVRLADHVLAGLLGEYQDIAIEQPAGTALSDGGSRSFGSLAVGAQTTMSFTLKNTGLSLLSGFPMSIDGTHPGDFSVTAFPVPQVSPGSTTTFTVRFTPAASGARSAVIHIASNDADENPFDITLTGTATAPEIAVEQPAGTDLADGTASIAFGSFNLGSSAPPRTFTIRNTGTANLTGLSVSKDGANTADFTVGSLGVTTLAPGASTIVNVTFAPVGGASGPRTAAIHIGSNDADENPFDIAFSGMAFSTTADIDNDGMNDWGEHQLAALGFDWQVSNAALVNTYFAAASSNGIYTASQMQALNADTPLLQRNPATGVFTLTIGVEKSTDLTSFNPLPFTAPQLLINGQGKIEFQFTVPNNAAFFRVQAQ